MTFSFPSITVDSLEVRVLGHGAKLNYIQMCLEVKNDRPAMDKRRFLFKI